MALKLLILLAVFAACGVAYAEETDYCQLLCDNTKGPTAKSVARGLKHRALRSKGHAAQANRERCITVCEDGGLSTRQGRPTPIGSAILEFPGQVMESVASGLSDFPFFSGGQSSGGAGSGSGSSGGGSGMAAIMGFPQEVLSGVFGGGGSSPLGGFPFSNGGSSGGQSSDSGTDSSSGESGILEFLGLPQQVISSFVGGSSALPFNGLPFSSGGGSSSGQSSGSGSGSLSDGLSGSTSGGGSGSTSSGGSGSSFGGGTGLSGLPGQSSGSVFGSQGTGESYTTSRADSQQSLIDYCEEACNIFVRNSKVGHQVSSGRTGLSHGQKGRHARRSALPKTAAAQHTRQLSCPSFCYDVLLFFSDSGSSSQSSSTGGSGTSSTGSDGSSSGSQSSSGSSGGTAVRSGTV